MDWLPVSPELLSPVLEYSFVGSPHPNAARLAMAWSVTPEAQAAVAASGRGTIDPPTAVEIAGIVKAKGIQLFTEDTIEQAKLDAKYRTMIAQMLGYVPGK